MASQMIQVANKNLQRTKNDALVEYPFTSIAANLRFLFLHHKRKHISFAKQAGTIFDKKRKCKHDFISRNKLAKSVILMFFSYDQESGPVQFARKCYLN